MVGTLHVEEKACKLKNVTADISFSEGSKSLISSFLYLAIGVRPSSSQNFEMVPFHVTGFEYAP